MIKTVQTICLFLSLSIIVQGQTFFEDFESYSVGSFASQGDHTKWIFDSTGVDDPVISDNIVYSGTKALKYEGHTPLNDTPVEAIFPVINDNLATISFQQYMDTMAAWSLGEASYISLNNVLNYGPNYQLMAWIVTDNFQPSYIKVGGQNYYFFIAPKQWVEYRFELNYLIDSSYFYYNDTLIAAWDLNIDASGNPVDPNYSQVNSLGIRSGLGEKVYYDDIRLDTYLVSTKEEGIIQSLKIYPNPTTGFIHINATLKETSDIHYQLYDVTGRVVDTWQEQETFNHQTSRDLSHLANGMYYLKMIAGTTATTKKIMLLR